MRSTSVKTAARPNSAPQAEATSRLSSHTPTNSTPGIARMDSMWMRLIRPQPTIAARIRLGLRRIESDEVTEFAATLRGQLLHGCEDNVQTRARSGTNFRLHHNQTIRSERGAFL